MATSFKFEEDSYVGETLLEWWQKLEDRRGDRADLRRAASVTDVAKLPAYQRLYARLDPVRECTPHEQDRLAAVVGLLAHLKVASEQSLPQAMSERPQDSDRNPVSELRFRRLLDSPDIDALFTGLRRVLPLIEHKADLLKLAGDVFYWGDKVKKRWAYDYRWLPSKD